MKSGPRNWSCEATAGTAGYYEITFTGKVQYTYRSTEAPNLERIEEESAEGKGEAVFVSVALDAPRYVGFSKDENAPTELTLSLSYSPSDLESGTVSIGIPDILRAKPIIESESEEEIPAKTSWNLENETEREAEKSVVCQAIKTGTGTTTASHSCGAKDEKEITVIGISVSVQEYIPVWHEEWNPKRYPVILPLTYGLLVGEQKIMTTDCSSYFLNRKEINFTT